MSDVVVIEQYKPHDIGILDDQNIWENWFEWMQSKAPLTISDAGAPIRDIEFEFNFPHYGRLKFSDVIDFLSGPQTCITGIKHNFAVFEEFHAPVLLDAADGLSLHEPVIAKLKYNIHMQTMLPGEKMFDEGYHLDIRNWMLQVPGSIRRRNTNILAVRGVATNRPLMTFVDLPEKERQAFWNRNGSWNAQSKFICDQDKVAAEVRARKLNLDFRDNSIVGFNATTDIHCGKPFAGEKPKKILLTNILAMTAVDYRPQTYIYGKFDRSTCG